MKSDIQRERLERGLRDTVDFYRGLILDMVEQENGGSSSWSFLRGRLLKALGDRGLSGRITEVLNAEFGVGGKKND